MEIDLLREFHTVSQSGSLRQAAAVLSISPATLSQHMNALEESLGVALFDRSNRRLALTDKGVQLAADSARLVHLYNQSLANIASYDEQRFQSLKVAISAEFMPFPLANALDSMNFRYPNLHLDILDDRDVCIEEGLDHQNVDLFLTFRDPSKIDDRYEVTPLVTTTTTIIVRNDHRLAKRSSVTLRDLDGECFILYPDTQEHLIRQQQIDILEQSGIHYSIYQTQTPHSLYTFLLPVGKGVMMIPWPMLNKLTPNSVPLTLEGDGAVMTYSMVYRKDNPNPTLHAIVKEVLELKKRRDPYGY